MMTAEILSSGDEVLRGEVVDSNAAYIATQLETIGLGVARHNCVGDDLEDLVKIVKEIAARSDIVIMTGGLGPTRDDLTTDAMSQAAGVKKYLNAEALKCIEQFLAARNMPMSEANKKQAWLPKEAHCLFNPVGTAPGFKIKILNCIFYCLPGVPSEMKHMMAETVLPDIKKQSGLLLPSDHQSFSIFGLGEAEVAEKLKGFETQWPDVKLGMCAIFPEIKVQISACHKNTAHLQELLQNAAEWIRNQIGDWIFATGGDSMASVIGRLLLKKKATLAIAESCTGGLIAHRITNVPGSSEYFLFSGVTYANTAKIKVLGVSESTLKQFGAVDVQTVKEMAEGVVCLSGATCPGEM